MIKTLDLALRKHRVRKEGKGFSRIHDPKQCLGQWCVFHKPSPHRMRQWPKNLRETGLIERMCTHGVGHPDPDSVLFANRVTGQSSWGSHGCDGCCRP